MVILQRESAVQDLCEGWSVCGPGWKSQTLPGHQLCHQAWSLVGKLKTIMVWWVTGQVWSWDVVTRAPPAAQRVGLQRHQAGEHVVGGGAGGGAGGHHPYYCHNWWLITLQYPTFQINETYVGVLKTIVEGLKQNGIYTYLDMHQVWYKRLKMWNIQWYSCQDVLNSVATYDGIPSWLFDKMTRPEHSYPWPMKDTSGGISNGQVGWWQWCLLPSLPQDSPPGLVATSPSRSATASSSSTPGTWLSLAMCGGRLPQGESLSYLPTRNTDDKLFRFRNMPEILGYELLNEPWTGDFYQVSWIVSTKISLNLIFVP